MDPWEDEYFYDSVDRHLLEPSAQSMSSNLHNLSNVQRIALFELRSSDKQKKMPFSPRQLCKKLKLSRSSPRESAKGYLSRIQSHTR